MFFVGLYTNGQIVPNLYNNQPRIGNNPNQKTFRLNYLQEILQQQQLTTSQLSVAYEELDHEVTESFKDMNHNLQRASAKQHQDLSKLFNRLDRQEQLIYNFLEAMKAQEAGNEIILHRLHELEKRNQLILENLEKESLINQALLDQVACQHASTEALTGKITQFESFSHDLTKQLNEQETVYEELSKKLEVQEVFHSTVMERLDQQEAIVQKISRQLDNLRSSLYERVSYLSEKMESGFKQLLKPVQSYFINEKEKNKKN